MKRAVLYIRVEECREGFARGLKIVQEAREALKGIDAELVETYVDFKNIEHRMNGQEDQRVSLKQMLEDAKQGKFDIVVTESMKNLGRKHSEVLPIIEDLLQREIGVYFYEIGVNTLDHAEEIKEVMVELPKTIDWKAYNKKKN